MCHTPRDKHVKPPQKLSAVTTVKRERKKNKVPIPWMSGDDCWRAWLEVVVLVWRAARCHREGVQPSELVAMQSQRDRLSALRTSVSVCRDKSVWKHQRKPKAVVKNSSLFTKANRVTNSSSFNLICFCFYDHFIVKSQSFFHSYYFHESDRTILKPLTPLV